MMILDFLVWAILLIIFAGVILILDYWGHLLREQDSYTRGELVDFYRIYLRQIENLTSARGDAGINYMAIGAGIGVAWALTLFGGLLSPDVTAASDHAEDQIPNYFFQSLLFPLILHIVWPAMKDVALDQGGPQGILSRLLNAEIPFFFAMAVALGSINLAVWGVYHHMNFLFAAINAGLCFVYAGYRLHTQELDDRGGMDRDAYDDEYAPGGGGYADDGEYPPRDEAGYDEGGDYTTAGSVDEVEMPDFDDMDSVDLSDPDGGDANDPGRGNEPY